MEETTLARSPIARSAVHLVACMVMCVFVLVPLRAMAATSLIISPTNSNVVPGGTVSLNIVVRTPDTAINAISGTVTFPADKLQVLSLSKSGSIISLWVQEPSFSNSAGTVHFEGIVLNPGFTGASGQILNMKFKAKDEGDARLVVANSAVLANDGSGTNVLSSVGGAKISIVKGVEAPEPPPAPAAPPTQPENVPPAPSITSITHPDQARWYKNPSVDLTWYLPPGVDGMSAAFDDKALTNPGTVAGKLEGIFHKEGLSDGVWYYHVRFHNKDGWGPAAHFGIHIDTTPPLSFELHVNSIGDAADYRSSVWMDAKDALSGISRYEVIFAEGTPESVIPELASKDKPYRFPFRAPGTYPFHVIAYDQAGNSTQQVGEVTQQGFAPPTITRYPSELAYGESLDFSGQTYPTGHVTLRLTNESGKTWDLLVDATDNGDFTAHYSRRLQPGTYTLSGQVTLQDQTSEWSPPVTVLIQPSLSGQLIDLTKAFQQLLVITGILGLLLFLFSLYFYLRYRNLRRKIRTRAHEVDEQLHASFRELREDVNRQLKLLEKASRKRKLTDEEKKMIAVLREHVMAAEASIHEELETLGKKTK